MRQAAARQDGVRLLHSTRYDEWEADMLTGCVCHEGWKGYDCLDRECPKGSDPLFNGIQETQTIRSVVTHRNEVQEIRIGGGVPVQSDEVQAFSFRDRASGVLSGTLAVEFDTTLPACRLCPQATRGACVRPAVAIDSTSANANARASGTAANLQAELLQCSNIDNVIVTGTATATDGLGMLLSVTFVGDRVGGDVPPLLFDVAAVTSNAGVPGVVADALAQTDGDEVFGDVVLTYDDTGVSSLPGDQNSWPALSDQDESTMYTEGGAGSTTISVGDTAAEVASALGSLPGINGTGLVIQVVHAGGPGLTYRVTFASGVRQRGNRPLILIDGSDPGSTLAPATNAGSGFTASAAADCSTITVTDGTFMFGTFQVGITFDGSALLTSSLAWNAEASAVQAAIEATDSALGAVVVTRSKYPLHPAEDWSGGYEWIVAFRSIPDNLPTMTTATGMLLDGDSDSTPGSVAGAGVTIVADSKEFETQRIRTQCEHQDEVQEIEIGGYPAANEVQRIRVSTTAGYPEGVLIASFDTTTGCTLCPSRVSATTGGIEIGIGPNSIASTATAAQRAEQAGINLKWQLQGLPNIDDVDVVAAHYIQGTSSGYEFNITFSGRDVAGNMPLLTAQAKQSRPAVWYIQTEELVEGEEISGYVVLSYDDSSAAATVNYPTPEEQEGQGIASIGDSSTGNLYVASTPAQIKAALEALPSLAGATIDVDVTNTGGAGVRWTVTFAAGARARGNRAGILCAATLVPAGANCTVRNDIQQGTFLSGSFRLQMSLNGANRTTEAIPWNETAASLQQTIERLFPNNQVGQLSVSREPYAPGGMDNWSGGHDWIITFLQQNQNLDVLGTLPQTLSCLQSTPRDGGAAVLATTLADGSGLAHVNEVQLIECTCPSTCSGGVKLSLLGEQTPLISHDALASDLVAALEFLDFVPTVEVRMAGGTTMCDADGVTTSITFTHNPTNVPPLRIEASDSTAMGLVSSSSGTAVDFVLLADGDEPRGTHGFKVRTGTRIATECSSRGKCSAGVCQCFRGQAAGDAELFMSSNNAGGSIQSQPADDKLGIHNCGHNLGTVDDCPRTTVGSCSGRGACSGPPSYVCLCQPGYGGPACEQTLCPSHPAWFSEATRRDVAHASTPCSSQGRCEVNTGTCICREGYRDASDCSLGPCPGNQLNSNLSCSSPVDPDSDRFANPTSCKTMRQLSELSLDSSGKLLDGASYTGWDADMQRGCYCSGWAYGGPRAQTASKRSGYVCDEWTCPSTEDPRRGAWDAREHEVQIISCNASSGTFQLEFEGVLTNNIPFDAFVLDRHKTLPTEISLELEILRLVSVPRATVEIVPDIPGDDVNLYTANNRAEQKVCSTSKKLRVTFLGLHGDVQLLRPWTGLLDPTGSVTISEETKGSKFADECSRRGVCDRSTGQCNCMRQYGSSDGEYGPGLLGDCGHLDTLYGFPGNGMT